ncbi:MAG TPA: bifunctional aldolase/short-chain dehydrogenase [Candidatus Deferrimicrobiaceae bacterium]|nr:bifunctional aldolase/short-chain dehydrogenase [Candidatus Deferrimicrobiaceae bacterium]
MKNRWSEKRASEVIARYGRRWGRELALRTYTSRLIGEEKGLVVHGGGNTSVKAARADVFGRRIPALFVKASGRDLATIEPDGHVGLDLEYLKRLRNLKELPDESMVKELATHRLDAEGARPSIEALLHAFLPAKYIDHTHPDAILALTNQRNGARVVRDALGGEVVVLDYIKPGFSLAQAASAAFDGSPGCLGMVLMKHGLLTWDDDARLSYEKTIALVTRAERSLAGKSRNSTRSGTAPSAPTARERYRNIAPILRGLLAVPTGDPDRPHRRVVLRPLTTADALDLVDSPRGKEIAMSPPLTADHLIRTKALPLWIEAPPHDGEERIRKRIAKGIAGYARRYDAYFRRHASRLRRAIERFDPMPRVILIPGLGAVCAGGDLEEAALAREITEQTLKTKRKIAAVGTYEGLREDQIFDMEYHLLQREKLAEEELPLKGSVALITGAAGAIGAGICQGILENGGLVAATDLPGDRLAGLVEELNRTHPGRIIGVPLDVTKPRSVAGGFRRVVEEWGGIDLLVVNAGAAHVAPLAEMDRRAFRRLERVNLDGTLHVLSEAARHFRKQATGGDIVLISTKNVFAPGARFGAYSATKAAAHQLARIASLELAEIDIRVNMVSPDAVFSHGTRKSGLWEEVGPERMHARGLDEKGLEEYYRNRNLLKARITATHVARAVLYFATRQTPTTGATIPVDGGLPDATPR